MIVLYSNILRIKVKIEYKSNQFDWYNITDKLSIEASRVDPEQIAPRSSLIWVHTVCHRGFLNISADEKSRRLLL